MLDKDANICPICGKEFYPHPEWVYRMNYGMTYVCSYKCTLEAERRQEASAKEARRKNRIKNSKYKYVFPDGYEAFGLHDACEHAKLTMKTIQYHLSTGKIKKIPIGKEEKEKAIRG